MFVDAHASTMLSGQSWPSLQLSGVIHAKVGRLLTSNSV